MSTNEIPSDDKRIASLLTEIDELRAQLAEAEADAGSYARQLSQRRFLELKPGGVAALTTSARWKSANHITQITVSGGRTSDLMPEPTWQVEIDGDQYGPNHPSVEAAIGAAKALVAELEGMLGSQPPGSERTQEQTQAPGSQRTTG